VINPNLALETQRLRRLLRLDGKVMYFRNFPHKLRPVKSRDIPKQTSVFTWMDVSCASLYGKLNLLILSSALYIGSILPPSFMHARHLFAQESIHELRMTPSETITLEKRDDSERRTIPMNFHAIVHHGVMLRISHDWAAEMAETTMAYVVLMGG